MTSPLLPVDPLGRPTPRRRALAGARARARRESAGAAMFVVAITLGLLAAMGVYGLSATAADVTAAGHVREALHGRSAGEHALVTTAETFNHDNAQWLVSQVTNLNSPLRPPADRPCRSANPPTGLARNTDAEGCIELTHDRMRSLVNKAGPIWPDAVPAFATDAFGPLTPEPSPVAPITRVEITNPVQVLSADGTPYKRVTVTVFVEMRDRVNPNLRPAKTVVAGRGRLTVGPVGSPPGSGGQATGGRVFDFSP